MADRVRKASKTRTKRPGWSVTFRHPCRTDALGKSGLKVRRGLGTTDEDEADRLVDQLNTLLNDSHRPRLGHRLSVKDSCQLLWFEPIVVSTFYDEM